MRKILFIILVLICVQSQAQRLQYVNNYGMEFQRILVDTSLGLPIDTFSVPSGYNKRAWLAAKGNTLYLWDTTLLKWSAFAGGSGSGTVTSVATGYGLSGGTITTSGTLVADTAVGAGLFPWQRWLKVRDSLAVVLGLKVNVSDTATMLGNYIRDRGYGLLKTGQTLYADTTSGGVTSWVRTKKVIDSLVAAGWGAGGSPGGSNTQYQYNNSSAFGGTNMTYNNSTGATTLTGSSNAPQFKILAHSGQSNANPIFRLRTSADGDLLDIHSDYYTNMNIGVDAGANNVFVLSTSGYDNTNGGYSAGNANTVGYLNSNWGKRAGASNISGIGNTNNGAGAGQNNLSNYNVNNGYHAGFGNKHGNSNTINGTEAAFTDTAMYGSTVTGRQAAMNGHGQDYISSYGFQNMLSNKGDYNASYGANGLYSNVNGVWNFTGGTNAGYNLLGSYSTIVGGQGALNATGSGLVTLGFQAGYNATGDDKLYIANSSTSNPLLYGVFPNTSLRTNASTFGIATTPGTDTYLFKADSVIANKKFSYATNINGSLTTPNSLTTRSLVDSLIGASTPTLQQVLTAGSTLTTPNGITGGGFDFDWDGMGDYSIVSDSSISLTANGIVGIQGQGSLLRLRTDSIEADKKIVYTGNINGTLTTPNALVTRSLVDSLLGTVGGGGLTIGTTTIGNSATKRIPYDSAGTVSSNAQFAWDFTNKRLGIGTDAPTFSIHQYENTTETTNAGIKIENAGNGDAAIHFARASTNYTIGLDQSNSSRFYISASTALGTNNGVIVASDGKVGLNGAAPAAGVTLGAGTASAFNAPLKFTSGTLNTTAEAGANEYNGNFYDTKVNAVRFARGGTLNVNTTDVGNVGTGVDDLQSYSIPAGTLSANGDFIEYEFVITFAANANNKTVRVVYGATEVYNSTAQAQNGGTLIVEGKIIRTGATTQRVTAKISTDGTLFTDIASYTTAAETLSGAVTLKATGEATSDNDIISKVLTVKFNGAN